MKLDGDGWVSGVRHAPSPNFDERPPGTAVELLVIHNISLPPGRFGGDAIERLFVNQLDPTAHPYFAAIAPARVSSHFLIARDGGVVQFVSCRQRAWHAGASSFEGRLRCNDFSVGVEVEGSDFVVYENAQYRALATLTACLRHALPLRAVRGHAQIAPGRKTDPGPSFDWPRFAREAALPATWFDHAALRS